MGAETITCAYIAAENDIENYKPPVTMSFFMFFDIDLISFDGQ